MAFATSGEHPVLNAYFENVVTLQSYLESCLPQEIAQQVLQAGDHNERYTSWLTGTRVAWNASSGSPESLEGGYEAAHAPLEEILQEVQKAIFQRAGTGRGSETGNVLCLGYMLVSLLVVGIHGKAS